MRKMYFIKLSLITLLVLLFAACSLSNTDNTADSGNAEERTGTVIECGAPEINSGEVGDEALIVTEDIGQYCLPMPYYYEPPHSVEVSGGKIGSSEQENSYAVLPLDGDEK